MCNSRKREGIKDEITRIEKMMRHIIVGNVKAVELCNSDKAIYHRCQYIKVLHIYSHVSSSRKRSVSVNRNWILSSYLRNIEASSSPMPAAIFIISRINYCNKAYAPARAIFNPTRCCEWMR